MDDKVMIFRVFVSGEYEIFNDFNVAMGYFRSQLVHNKIDNIVVHSMKITSDEYAAEVERQDSK